MNSVAIAKAGNYRLDVSPNGDEFTVREGKVIHRERSVDGCRKIAGATILDCDKKRNDNFDYWSQYRGEGEVFLWREMRIMSTLLAGLRRSRFRNTGFWYQQPGQTNYTFVPFTSQNFRSPYGGNYSTVLAPRRPALLNRIDVMVRPSINPTPRIVPRQP